MEKRVNYLTTALIMFFILSGIGRADQNSTMRHLMNEPVSLLDYGILRLETFLKSKDMDNFLKVGFDSNDDKIEIIFAYFLTKDIVDKEYTTHRTYLRF